MMYNNIIDEYVPKEWALNGELLVYVNPQSAEFNLVKNYLNEGYFEINEVYRHENVNQYGQFLLRQQAVSLMDPKVPYYDAIKFAGVPSDDCTVYHALECNMDERRCDFDVMFFPEADELEGDDGAVFICSTITTDPDDLDGDFFPEKSSDLYIRYVVYVDDLY